MKQPRILFGLMLALFTLSLVLLRRPDPVTDPRRPANRSLAGGETKQPDGSVWVSQPAAPTISPPFSQLPYWDGAVALDREINPRFTLFGAGDPSFEVEGGPDPLLHLQAAAPPATENSFLTPIVNVAGASFTGVNPPDTVGEIGPNHYVQTVNAGGGAIVTIYDKSGALLDGPWSIDALGTGPCASGLGDPIVLYDELADRWLLSEFSGTANVMCVYISQTNNPITTSWFAYQFVTPDFPDYPKYGVWPDAYYVTANESSPSAYALDRAAMLAGSPATMQRFTAPRLSGFPFQAMTPADLDGSVPPPAGAPNTIMRHRDDEVHAGTSDPGNDFLEIWAFHVDWATPANSTFSQIADIPVADFDSTLCGLSSFFCFPQPGSAVTLDPLREVVMWRLQYRNFGSHETLAGNLVTDVTGNDDGGIRWFELRKSGASPWALFQEGTYAPDGDSRWMGSSALDSSGNLALGYSVSSDTTFPSIRYAGRLVGDPAGTLPQSEGVVINGTAANASNRWGDYSAMNVDPVDGCTFWFTNMYNSSSQWSTRIAAFRFDACGAPDFYLSATPDNHHICAGDTADWIVTVGSISGYNGSVELDLDSGLPPASSLSISPFIGNAPYTSTNTLSTDANNTPAGLYPLILSGVSSTATHTTTVSVNIFDAVPAAVSLVSPANGASNVPVRPPFTWTAAGQGQQYVIEIASDAGFSNIVDSATVPGTSYTPAADLSSNTTFYWRVRAANACGAGSNSPTFSFVTEPLPGDCSLGASPVELGREDFESGASGWSHGGTGDTWSLSGSRPHGGSFAYHAAGVSSVSEQYLYSPAFALPAAAWGPITLQFWNWQEIEDRSGGCFDGGVLEVSTDGGASWSQIPDGALQTDPYDGPISTSFGNPLGGRDAWCGDPQAYLNSIVDLDVYAGQTVQFRFGLATDSSVSREGWYIDDVRVQACTPSGFGPVSYLPVLIKP